MAHPTGISSGGTGSLPPPASATRWCCFEPPFPLVCVPEVWVLGAGDPEAWGGATVAWSEDGDWYPENASGEIGGEPVVGVLEAPLPADADGLGHTLRVAHRGKLRPCDAGAAERMQSLCYLGDGWGAYELVCLSGVELLERTADGAHRYRLTGPLRRGCYGTTPVAHQAGTIFGRLDSNVARLEIPPRLLLCKAALDLRMVGTGGDEPEDQEDPADTIPWTYQLEDRFDVAGTFYQRDPRRWP